MPTKMFVNLPVKNLDRSRQFFASLGFELFGASDDMASIIISEHTQVMLLTEPVFATYTSRDVADATTSTEAILALGLADRAGVDQLVETALASGAAAAGDPRDSDGRYQRGFFDLDGHRWEALCLQ